MRGCFGGGVERVFGGLLWGAVWGLFGERAVGCCFVGEGWGCHGLCSGGFGMLCGGLGRGGTVGHRRREVWMLKSRLLPNRLQYSNPTPYRFPATHYPRHAGAPKRAPHGPPATLTPLPPPPCGLGQDRPRGPIWWPVRGPVSGPPPQLIKPRAHLLPHGLARVEHAHDRAHRLGRADGGEAGHAAADHEHLGGGDPAPGARAWVGVSEVGWGRRGPLATRS